MSDDPLLQPFQLKHLRLRNRIMITSHEPAYAEEGLPKGRYRAYHAERARAGVALTMTAGSASVSRDSPPVFNNILAWKDEVVGWMRELTDECHEHGAAVMIQLSHLGRRTRWDKGDWLPVLSSGGQREPAHRAVPKRIEDWDIERVITDYADAAERMQAAGVDGIELEAYGHLMDQFWTPGLNQLEAPWGGALEDRMRFGFEVLRAIRARCGTDFIVGIRYSGDERMAGGFGAAEGLEISQRLKDSGLVDFLNVVRGHIDTDAGLTDLIPVQGMANAPHLDCAGAIRKATGFPTFHAAKIPDLATARHAVSAGLVDMVGMTRAHLADPHLVRKLREGREEEIRPCVGANYCLDRIYQGGMAFCLHNAASGREETMPHEIAPAPRRQRVTIIGAGPGGMEAARVASARGHEVTVFEAANAPGGQILLTAQDPRRREMQAVIGWRLSECERRGVRFHFNTFAGEAEVLETRPDQVIIATGGLPQISLPEGGEDLTVSAWDILSGDQKPGREVLICDEAGDHAGLQAADLLTAAGARVEMINPDRSLAPEVMAMNLVPYMRNLQSRETVFTLGWRLLSVRAEGNRLCATLGTDYSDHRIERRVDQVVVNQGTAPLDDLYFALKPGSVNLGAVDYQALIAGAAQEMPRNPAGTYALYRIGDAVASRNTHAAIYDALRLMKDI